MNTKDDALLAIAVLSAIAGLLGLRDLAVRALAYFYEIRHDAEFVALDRRYDRAEDAGADL